MSLDDLREQLRTDAESVTPPDAVRRVHAVRELNRTRRRRKVAAVVVATVAGVATLVAVPMLRDLAGGPEPVDKPSAPFPEKVDGDTRIASAMGEDGDNSVTLTFTPDDTDFLLDIECDDLAPADGSTRALKSAPTLRVTVNETSVMPACGKRHDIGSGLGLVGDVATRDQVRSYWEGGGVRAGEQVTVTIHATRGLTEQSRPVPIDGRVGVAAYDMTGERVGTGGAALPEEKTVDGRTYDLGGYDVTATGPTTASVDVPTGAEPALVTYGTRSWLGGVRRVTVDGERGVFRGKGGVFTEPLPDARAHTVEISDRGAGAMPTDVVVAYYTPTG